MSFSDIAGRFKKHAQATEPAVQPKEIDYNELYALRGRIVGVLIRDARVAKGFTVENLAELMRHTPDQLLAWEFGSQVPSLPQLELLAYWLEVPLSHFLSGTETLIDQMAQRSIEHEQYLDIRDHMIGTLIRQAREQAGYTSEYLAQQTGVDADTLRAYEYGQQAIPLTHLTTLASVLRVNVTFFTEGTNRVGRYLEAQEVFETFLEMDPEVRHFIAKPSNHRYIELAMKLADMEINKLRQIAESILEITY